MVKLVGFALLSYAFLAAAVSVERESECLSIDEKRHLDVVLSKVRSQLPDPLRLPPRSSLVDLQDGLLWGLSNLTRTGETKITCEGRVAVVALTLTTDEVKGRYTWTYDAKLHSDKEGYVVFISRDFLADVEVEVAEAEGGGIRPELRKLEIQRFKDAKIETTGLGFLTWTVGEMTTLLSGIFQRSIARAVQGPLAEGLERALREISVGED